MKYKSLLATRSLAGFVIVGMCVSCSGSSASVPMKASRRVAPLNRKAGLERSRGAAQCTTIERFRKQPARHIPVGTLYEHYDSSPPTSGPHWPISADPGFYRVEVPPEELVHNLEHGQIVIWYAPDIAAETRTTLERLVARHSEAILAVPSMVVKPPYDFVLTAWGASQSCTRAAMVVIDHFRDKFQGRGPEDVGVPTLRGER